MVGADPSFSETHVVRALFTLHGKTTGRKKLVRVLGIGEGSVRTIIKRLSAEGLVASAKQGHSLTQNGRRRVASVLKKFSIPVRVELDIVGGEKSLVVVYGSTNKVKSGVSERDTALKAGADGAMVLSYSGGRLVFPSTGPELSRFEGLWSLSSLGLSEGDVVVVSFAGSYPKAEDGAVAVALELCGQ